MKRIERLKVILRRTKREIRTLEDRMEQEMMGRESRQEIRDISSDLLRVYKLRDRMLVELTHEAKVIVARQERGEEITEQEIELIQEITKELNV